MSGPGIHHIVAAKVADRFSTETSEKFIDHEINFTRDMISGPLNPCLNLGCQGPDWLFFLSKDWDPSADALVKAYLDIDHFITDMKDKIMALIPPELIQAVEDLKQAADDVIARSSAITVIKDLLQRAKNTTDILNKDLTLFTEKYITDSVDLFELFTTAYHSTPANNPRFVQDPNNPADDRDSERLRDWWWFDTLHYRRTGDFTKALLTNATPGTNQMAFALGYLTHYACDTVGHPYVNTMVGGPYRTHSQRHKFVESHQDVWAWKHLMNDTEFIKSDLALQHYILDPANEDILPPEINDLILKSLKDVYFDPSANKWLYGKEVTAKDLNDAYQSWRHYFTGVTNVTTLPEPVPFSYSKEAAEIFDRFKSNVVDLGNTIAAPFTGSPTLLNILEAIALAILSPFLLAAAAIDFLIGEVESIAAAPLNYMLSFTYEQLYTAFQNLHYGLSLNGLAFPFKDQLDLDISMQTTDNGIPDKNGNTALSTSRFYPMKKFKIPGMENASHLVYPFPSPGNAQELDPATAAPDAYYGQTPDIYIDGKLKYDDGYMSFLSTFKPGLNITERESEFNKLLSRTKKTSLGNAVDFSVVLMEDFIANGADANFPNFNLDGDRGFGFRGWRLVDDASQIGKESFDHTLIDIPDNWNGPVRIRTEDKDVPNSLTDILEPNTNVL